ncbi:MAG: hypothetical protein Q7R85_02305 [bacterium]|nr:hypothetical protein [bacterium]
MKTRHKTWLWMAMIVIVGALLIRFILVGPKVVPAEFTAARQTGTRLTEEIIFLASASRSGLEDIARYDAEANTSEALIATSRELIRNKDVRERAVSLSVELGRMAQALPNIQPGSARQIASEAIGYEVALVSRLISYNDILNRLFELLRAKFTGQVTETDGKVRAMINDINAGANAANDLNAAFVDAMKRFDDVYQ